jgi:hypothetical protein
MWVHPSPRQHTSGIENGFTEYVTRKMRHFPTLRERSFSLRRIKRWTGKSSCASETAFCYNCSTCNLNIFKFTIRGIQVHMYVHIYLYSNSLWTNARLMDPAIHSVLQKLCIERSIGHT